MTKRATLQLVMIDYHAAAWLGESLASAQADGEAWDRVELTVVDNSVDEASHAALLEVLPEEAQVIRPPENLGFAKGCNLAVAQGTAPYLLFVNPDTRWPPGGFQALVERLEERGETALLGPRHYADDACRYVHAALRGVRLFDEAHDLWWARGWDQRRPDRLLAERDRLRLRTGAVKTRALSGGCLGTSRALYEHVGGFDERFWMYGEDVELCVRARRRGAGVEIHPDLSIVHYMERSARRVAARVDRARGEGRILFKERHHSALARAIERGCGSLLARLLPVRRDPFAAAEEGLPDAFERPEDCECWAVELARSPLFDNCLTHFVDSASSVPAPRHLLGELPEATYYARTAGRSDGRWLTDRVFRFPRPAPAEERPIEETC